MPDAHPASGSRGRADAAGTGLRVGLLFGGRSVEHEVSVVSARGVADAMRRTSLRLVPLAVGGDGRCFSPDLSARILAGASARVEVPGAEDDGARVVVDPGGGGLLELTREGSSRPLGIDVLFPLVHGWGGEDGRLQGALDLSGVAYVGSGVLGSAVGMDKALAKHVLSAHGIPVAPWVLISRDAWLGDRASASREVARKLRFPVFVKPANGGSSVGISKVAQPAALESAIEHALRHDRRVVVEQGIDAREIECAVLGNSDPEASGLGEIVPSREFYDYEAKYHDDSSRLVIPAEIDPARGEEIRALALTTYRALDLAGFARVDFLVERGTGRPYLNEVNTLPGFTPISMFPKLWEAAGLAYPRLIERLVGLALERAEIDRGRVSRREGHGGGV